MFARTPRLTLRPAWPEDAPLLAAAIGHKQVARTLGGVPFPYSLADAEAWVTQPRDAHEPRFLIIAHDRPIPQMVGGIAIAAQADAEKLATLGYWLTPDAWGCGYATDAGRAVVDMDRYALPLTRLGAWHFADNPASGRVLRKLGFKPTGATITKAAAGRTAMAPCTEYELDLTPQAQCQSRHDRSERGDSVVQPIVASLAKQYGFCLQQRVCEPAGYMMQWPYLRHRTGEGVEPLS